FDDNLSGCRMIVAQERHYVFRVSAFRESGKATQVAEQRSDLPAMTFELLFGPRCHDQVSDLWRQETAQPAHALDLANLIGAALFGLVVELRYLLCSLTQFVEQPHVLDGDHRLVGESPEKLNLPLGKASRLRLRYGDGIDRTTVLKHWDRHNAAVI